MTDAHIIELHRYTCKKFLVAITDIEETVHSLEAHARLKLDDDNAEKIAHNHETARYIDKLEALAQIVIAHAEKVRAFSRSYCRELAEEENPIQYYTANH